MGATVCDAVDTPASLKSDMRRHVGFLPCQEMRKEKRQQTARKQSADTVGLELVECRGLTEVSSYRDIFNIVTSPSHEKPLDFSEAFRFHHFSCFAVFDPSAPICTQQNQCISTSAILAGPSTCSRSLRSRSHFLMPLSREPLKNMSPWITSDSMPS